MLKVHACVMHLGHSRTTCESNTSTNSDHVRFIALLLRLDMKELNEIRVKLSIVTITPCLYVQLIAWVVLTTERLSSSEEE